MCGIAGVLGRGPVATELLSGMATALIHRGPDDGGVWRDAEAGIGLAHRRLAIVDLSPHGHQPMASADGRFVLSYNGEVYNHHEIRAELERAGRGPEGDWRGHSDTETLLAAIAAWGLEAALERAVGMFAFALWDREARVLKLVRDRFGEKPLYYGWAGRDFVFASELKAIRVHPNFAGEVDRRALTQFAARTYVPAPLSIYRGIFKLEPGCILTVDPARGLVPDMAPPNIGTAQGGLRLARYWSYLDVVRGGLRDPIAERGAALDELDRVLGQAVRDQAVADVPVGAFLSGGIDSSTIVALYQKYSTTPVRTFTIGFDEKGFDEAQHAKQVAAHFGTVHHEHYVSVAEAREVIPALPTMYDEPFADSSQIPTYLVSRFARAKVTVALTGDGGDELFGGYNRHVSALRMWDRVRRVPRPLRAVGGKMLARLPSDFWRGAAAMAGRNTAPNLGSKVQKALRVAGDSAAIGDVYESFLDEWSHEPSPMRGGGRPEPIGLSEVGSDSAAVRMMAADAVTYLPDDILCKVDRASMAVSLETRVPFLDHRVAEVAGRIPVAMKIARGQGKTILRELLYREAPRALFERPKTGFGIPVGDWLKGPLRDWAEDLLDPVRMRDEGWFDPAIVQRRWRDHLTGRRSSTPALWAILSFQAWLRAQRD